MEPAWRTAAATGIYGDAAASRADDAATNGADDAAASRADDAATNGAHYAAATGIYGANDDATNDDDRCGSAWDGTTEPAIHASDSTGRLWWQ